ncbi:aminoacyl-tRNA deacylase [Nitriliruptor alkaliphilus]|uniref:aminoacyl-tRNA deacylase n=1 Tax=Nitriliruptor alkaliphilus TaxID=427918 RepID=UPI000695C73E|nr:YbaK/EbsC family protein [Nitriliruptor alkaliphilus]
MAADRLHALLDEHDVHHEVTTHTRAVTADRLAEAEGVSGYDIAKPVMINVGGQLAMVVVPGAELVDLDAASDVFGHNAVRLAMEEEFVDVFDDCEPGAEPPFGVLYGIPTFLEEDLRARDKIVCRDGTHTRTITLAMTDYLRLVSPEIIRVARSPA